MTDFNEFPVHSGSFLVYIDSLKAGNFERVFYQALSKTRPNPISHAVGRKIFHRRKTRLRRDSVSSVKRANGTGRVLTENSFKISTRRFTRRYRRESCRNGRKLIEIRQEFTFRSLDEELV